MGTSETVSPELLLTEFEVRQAHGGVDLDDYAQRFPQQIHALKELAQSSQELELSERAQASIDTSRPGTAQETNAEKSSRFTELPFEFGRYRILRKLGEGAMGAVYLAQDTQLDREVALKTPSFDGAEWSELIERFYREARSAATLRHANVCPKSRSHRPRWLPRSVTV